MSDLLPISLVANYVYCPRRAWMEAAGERVSHVNIEHGLVAHERVDARSDDRPQRRESVEIHDQEWGTTGKADLVKNFHHQDFILTEFKSTPGRRVAEVTEANRIQLALQRHALETMGYAIASQEVYFTDQRRSVRLELGEDDFAEAKRYVEATRVMCEEGRAPAPPKDNLRCHRCSHAGVCLPEEHRAQPVVRPIKVP